jgi:hypothetical protein
MVVAEDEANWQVSLDAARDKVHNANTNKVGLTLTPSR